MTDTPNPTNPEPIIPPSALSAEAAPAPAVVTTQKRKKNNVINPYVWGTGRRKSSVARVRIKPGDGKFIVNKKDVDEFFCLGQDRLSVRKPLEATDTVKSFDVFVNVCGGGTTGQAGAIVLGLARALLNTSEDYWPALRHGNLLTRDARCVERKKYGQRGARRKFQFSKR